MASRVSSRRHFFRDLPPAVMLLGCAVIGVIILTILFPYWSPLPAEKTTKLHLKDVEPQLNEFNFDKRYAGAIVTDSLYEDKCRELVFDNRNGNMWDKGYVNCDGVLFPFLQQDQPRNMDKFRLREVGKAFRHEHD